MQEQRVRQWRFKNGWKQFINNKEGPTENRCGELGLSLNIIIIIYDYY